MTQPIAIDLFCGLGGWTEGLLAEGYYVVGFDIERHVYGELQYPAQLVLQDVLTIHGRQFRHADLIVASPPCQEYSYMAMPWSRAKQIAREYRDGTRDVKKLTALFDACFRIQREASEAAGRHIPLVVENVRGAQEWVGRSRWAYGSFHLWGDVPALMPLERGRKNGGGSWFNVAHNTTSGKGQNPDGRLEGTKVGGFSWSDFGKPDYKAQAFNGTAEKRARDGVKCGGSGTDDEVKLGGSWFHEYRKGQGPRNHGSKSKARKRASALIAKIPLALARHIARVYHPQARAA